MSLVWDYSACEGLPFPASECVIIITCGAGIWLGNKLFLWPLMQYSRFFMLAHEADRIDGL